MGGSIGGYGGDGGGGAALGSGGGGGAGGYGAVVTASGVNDVALWIVGGGGGSGGNASGVGGSGGSGGIGLLLTNVGGATVNIAAGVAIMGGYGGEAGSGTSGSGAGGEGGVGIEGQDPGQRQWRHGGRRERRRGRDAGERLQLHRRRQHANLWRGLYPDGRHRGGGHARLGTDRRLHRSGKSSPGQARSPNPAPAR